MTIFVAILFALVVAFGIRMAIRSIIASAKVKSTKQIELDKAHAQARGVLHASDDNLARTVDEMRAIGRGEKEP